jgi:quercetin dioxygenase-like cupin family protein
MTDRASATVVVIDSKVTRKPLPLVRGAGSAHAILWPGNGAHYRSFNVLDMAPGDTTRDLSHDAECIYYVERGGGAIRDLAEDAAQELVEGSMIHIEPGDRYRLEAGGDGMRLIGGTVPVDPALYEIADEEVAP